MTLLRHIAPSRVGVSMLLVLLALGSGCGRQSEPPVVVIGLDGADWDLLIPWMEAGELPNLKAFLDEALVGDLETVVPILSPVCWTSASTGVNPGKHGIYDFQRTDPDGGPPLVEQATNRRAQPVWMLLSDLGYRVGVMNVPMTYPPDPVRGTMVSGFPFPDEDVVITYPPELHDELPNYPLDYLGLSMRQRGPDELYRDFIAGMRVRGKLGREWIESGDYDFLWYVFTGPDKVQHFFWKHMDPNHPNHDPEQAKLYRDAILDLWRTQDEILGELLDALPPEARVLMMSDHGFEAIYRQVNMANWLAGTDLNDWLQDHAIPPMLITNGIVHYVLEGQLAGASDREEFIDILSALCLDMRDPKTGEAPFEKVYRREEVYQGRTVEKAPDIVFYENPFYYVTSGDPSQELHPIEELWATSFSAYHRPKGILAMRGPGVRRPSSETLRDRILKGTDFNAANIMDVAPTILAMYCETIPDQMDGRPLIEALDDALGERCVLTPAPVAGFLLDRDPPKLSQTEKEALKAIPYIN